MTNNQIYLERLQRPGSPPVPVTISLVAHGPNFYIKNRTDDGLNFILKMSASTLLATFGPIVDAAAGSLNPGLIKGETGQEQFYNFIKLSDLSPDMPTSQKLALLIERFRATLPDIADVLQRDYRSITGQSYTDPGTNQLDHDLALIQPLAEQLISDGQLIYGAKAKIARVLKIKNAGAGHRRIKTVSEKLLASATSTPQKTVSTPVKWEEAA